MSTTMLRTDTFLEELNLPDGQLSSTGRLRRAFLEGIWLGKDIAEERGLDNRSVWHARQNLEHLGYRFEERTFNGRKEWRVVNPRHRPIALDEEAVTIAPRIDIDLMPAKPKRRSPRRANGAALPLLGETLTVTGLFLRSGRPIIQLESKASRSSWSASFEALPSLAEEDEGE